MGDQFHTLRVFVDSPAIGPIDGGSLVSIGTPLNLDHDSLGGTWTSSNTSVATVNALTGVVTGVAAGSATIYYSTGVGCPAFKPLYVAEPGSAGPITGNLRICNGTSTTLSPAASGGTWSSGNPSVATVSSAGLVASVAGGTAAITYTIINDYGVNRTIKTVTVDVAPVAGVSGAHGICLGHSYPVSSTAAGGTWSSSNTAVVTINSTTGVATGVGLGTTVLTYSVSNSCGTAIGTHVLTVDTVPNPGHILGVDTVCEGSMATFTPTVPGGFWEIYFPATIYSNGEWAIFSDASNTADYRTEYIYYGVTNSCNTSYTVKPLVIKRQYPVPPIVGPAVLCVGDTATYTNVLTGGIWFVSPALMDVEASGFSTAIEAGVTSLYYGYTHYNGCPSSAMFIISITDTPSAGTISGTLSTCAGSTVSLSSTASGGAWSSTNTAVATIGSSSGIVSGVAPGTSLISYTVTGSCGTASASLVLTVNTATDAATISGTATVCQSATTTLSVDVTGGTWSSSNTAVATVGSSSGIVTGVAAGTATITYTLTACGTTVSTVVVTVNPAPSGGTIAGTTIVCPGATTTLASTVSGGTWSSSNTAVATIGSSSGLATGVAPGTAVITYSAANSCGTATATILVTVNASPSAGTLSGTSSLCPSATATLSSTVTGGTWSSANTAVATVGSASGIASGAAAGTATISYSVTNSCGTATATTIVTVNPAPAAGTISGDGTLCTSATTTLVSTVSGGTWSSSNTVVATVGSSSGVVTGIAAGTAVISYNAANSCGTATATAIVTVSASPSAGTLSGAGTLCPAATLTLSSTISGGTWSSSNTTVASVAAGVVTGLTGGTARITYTVTSSCGTAFATAVVTVSPAANAGVITGGSSVLVGGGIMLSSSVSGGTWSSSNTAVATVTATGGVTGIAPGTVTISYTVTNSCGSDIATRVITVNPAVSPVTGSLSICGGGTTVLGSSTAGGTWSSNNPTVATVSSSGVVSGFSPGVAIISYITGAGYTTAAVTVHAMPAVITGATIVCAGSEVLYGSATAGGTWSSSNTAVASINAAGLATGVTAGVATISYANSAGCARTITLTVNTQPASITGSTAICPGTTTTLSNAVSGGSWTGGVSTIASVGSTGVVTGVNAGTARITYSIGSCRSTVVVTVSAAPSAITGTPKVCPGTITNLGSSPTGGTWSSSTTAVAVVSSTGIVTGVAAGVATITYATGAGCYRTAVVTVNPLPSAITGSPSVCPGGTTMLSSVTAGLTWSSSNTAVAAINASTGQLTGMAAGTATITYRSAGTGCYVTAVATVNTTPATISGPGNVCPGSSITLTNTVAGGTWSSSNTTAATVDAATGVLTGVAAGYSTITYTAGAGCYKTKLVTVHVLPGTITGYPTVCQGRTTTLVLSGSGTWSSSNPGVASIPLSSRTVTGVSAGTATITFTSITGCIATYAVTVIPMPAAITGSTTICSGQTTTLSNASPGGSWQSANPAVASVGSSTGIVSGIWSAGTVSISYTYGSGCSVSVPVIIHPLPAAIAGTYSVCATAATTLTNTIAGGTWSSTNTAVATVGTGITAGHGVVSGIAAGTTTVSYTLTATGCARTAVVTVNACSRPAAAQEGAGGGVAIYPNPTTGDFKLVSSEAGMLHVFTLTGREVVAYPVSAGVNELRLPADVATGVYMCRFVGEQGATTIVRLVYER